MSEQQIQISEDIYNKSVEEVDDAIVFMQFYHYLAHLNYLSPLKENYLGAIIVPFKMLSSIGYGFAKNDQVFCLHLSGLIKDYFERFTPIHCILTEPDEDEQGVIFMMKPLKYGDYFFPPIQFFFPVSSPRIMGRIRASSDKVCFTEIERSIIKPECFEVKSVLDGYVAISTKESFTNEEEDDVILRMF